MKNNRIVRDEKIEVRLTKMEILRYKNLAKNYRMSLSELIRRRLDQKTIEPKLTDENMELLKLLLMETNKWQSISNMFKKKDPKISLEVESLIKEFRCIITNNFK